MPSLARTDSRFKVTFEILEGGQGTFQGVISEPDQGEVPSYIFNLPRRLLRVPPHLPLAPRMVVRDLSGAVFMLAEHGAAAHHDELTFRNFRMFQADNRYTWKRRSKTIDPITKLERDGEPTILGQIWGAYEPTPEQFDRTVRASFEEGRFITAAEVLLNDIVNEKRVTRVDVQLGLSIATLG